MANYCLSLGSNLQREQHLGAALRELRDRFGVLAVSAVYESEAVGFEGPPFWNLAVALESELDADALKAWLHDLEDRHGRRRDVPRYSSRSLDVDIVAIDGRAMERPELEQGFVLAPLAEIAPQLLAPGVDETIVQAWDRLQQAGAAPSRRIPAALAGQPDARP